MSRPYSRAHERQVSDAASERPRTLGELRQSGYVTRPVREEMRRNLLGVLARGERLLPGIIGFDESVIPEIENALLAGHHIVFLGERGQAKSRIIRGLLGCSTPPSRRCAAARCTTIRSGPSARRAASAPRREGDGLELEWIGREARYGEKLATPDTSIADLIGEVDPIKVAEGRYLADEDTIHYGLIPRSNRGIFAINELPDLTEKVQVGLFNLMEEKDVQIKGYRIMLPLDVVIVASANPEDYTSRGRIITPLKDRFDVQIRTHYPRTLADEIAIMEQELPVLDRAGRAVHVPDFLKEILAQFTFEARACPEINQSSGVSVRVTINNYESVLSNAEKRAVRLGEPEIVPRLLRSARALRLHRRQDRDRVRRRGAQRERHHRAAAQSRRAGGVRPALQARGADADRRPLRIRLGRRGERHDAAPRTISKACRRSPACATPSAGSAPTRAPASSPRPPSWCSRACICTRS